MDFLPNFIRREFACRAYGNNLQFTTLRELGNISWYDCGLPGDRSDAEPGPVERLGIRRWRVSMAKRYRVIAHGMHENELQAAARILPKATMTASFVTGEAGEADIAKLESAGLIVQKLAE